MSTVSRWVGLMCLVLTLLWNNPALAATSANPPMSEVEVTARLQDIVNQMQRLRFCSRNSCRYRDLAYQVQASPTGLYRASIDAVIDRPSTVIDTGHYELAFANGHWQLLRGEEYTDVSSFSFRGDRYEIESVYSNRSTTGRLSADRADSNVLSGYRALYFDVLKNGVERPQLPEKQAPSRIQTPEQTSGIELRDQSGRCTVASSFGPAGVEVLRA
ncbi:hypothetical protein [Leptolyngbya sp. FACHB-261]|uniref:hypothetical protein n=1 Tax=Leptolyngbya sp. FACHB-261 TaxID=2692806 RepID=UPI0016846548|nr:hypothetical protein [Leptolyngbya sp. FACHB-261]MBD2101287.1 hypothetical protein [Leptolyngbya sp. FACHB-261]